MSLHFQRAKILIEQSRFELAEKELRQQLTVSPEYPATHALLAFCLAKQKRYPEALEEARLAVHLGPEMPYCHYVLGSVLDDLDRLDEAEAAVREAIRLDPEDADYLALLGGIRFERRQWLSALEAVEQGLRIDPEHVGCTNLRAMALIKLGRRQEAGATIDAALAKNPENALTHANQGWSLLERGDPVRAMEHFREALRLNPQLEWAREGVVEALKARYFVYRLLLRYFFWMSRLSKKAQWGFILGGYLAFRILAPLLGPLVILYFAFTFLSWVADPLFNLLLRLNRFGRLVLSREQVVASNWVGICLLAALTGLGTWLSTGNPLMLLAFAGGIAMILPVAGTFSCKAGRGRKVLGVYTAFLAGIGLTGLGLALAGSPAAIGLGALFFAGWLIFGWIANFILSRG